MMMLATSRPACCARGRRVSAAVRVTTAIAGTRRGWRSRRRRMVVCAARGVLARRVVARGMVVRAARRMMMMMMLVRATRGPARRGLHQPVPFQQVGAEAEVFEFVAERR